MHISQSILVYLFGYISTRILWSWTSRQLVKSTVDVLNRLLSSRYVVQKVTAEDLASPSWKSSTSLLVFPGGQTTPYVRELIGTPVDNVIEYVENGGKYLGFCAGAYFAAHRVEFMPGTPYEVIANRPLGFFPGALYGTTFPRFDYYSDKGALATNITFSFSSENETIESFVYYNGGSSFINVDSYPNVTILAKYNEADNESHKIAATLCNVGKGKALLSSVHPEYLPTESSESLYREIFPYKRTIERVLKKWFHVLDLALASDDNYFFDMD